MLYYVQVVFCKVTLNNDVCCRFRGQLQICQVLYCAFEVVTLCCAFAVLQCFVNFIFWHEHFSMNSAFVSTNVVNLGQTWSTNVIVKCSITNKQNHNVIDYDYIESNHDYICLEKSSERKQSLFVWFDV